MHGLLPSQTDRGEPLTNEELAVIQPDEQVCCNYDCSEKAEFGVEFKGLFKWYCARCFGLVTLHTLETHPYEGSC